MKEERSNIIKAITTPLGFFALSLLIVEAFLGTTLVFSKGNESANFCFWGMVIGASLFFIVVLGVWLLVWFNPENIVKAGRDYVEIEKIKAKQITEKKVAQTNLESNSTLENPEAPKDIPENLVIEMGGMMCRDVGTCENCHKKYFTSESKNGCCVRKFPFDNNLCEVCNSK